MHKPLVLLPFLCALLLALSPASAPAKIPPREAARMQLQSGHQSEITALKVTKDEKYLVSGDLSGNVILWDVATGNQIWRYLMPTCVRNFQFSNDGEFLYISATERARYSQIDTVLFETGMKVTSLQQEVQGNDASDFHVSQDGESLCFSLWTPLIYSAKNGTEIHGDFFKDSYGSNQNVSSDCRYAILRPYKASQWNLHDLLSGKRIRSLIGTRHLKRMVFDTTGKYLAAIDVKDNNIVILSVDELQIVKKYPRNNAGAIWFDANSNLLLAADLKNVYVHDLTRLSSSPLRLEGLDTLVRPFLMADGVTMIACTANAVVEINLSTMQRRELFSRSLIRVSQIKSERQIDDHEIQNDDSSKDDYIQAHVLSGGKNYFFGVNSNNEIVRHVVSSELSVVSHPLTPINDIDISDDRIYFVTGKDDGSVSIWDMHKKERLERIFMRQSSVAAVKYIGQNRFAVSYADGHVGIVNAANPSNYQELQDVVLNGWGNGDLNGKWTPLDVYIEVNQDRSLMLVYNKSNITCYRTDSLGKVRFQHELRSIRSASFIGSDTIVVYSGDSTYGEIDVISLSKGGVVNNYRLDRPTRGVVLPEARGYCDMATASQDGKYYIMANWLGAFAGSFQIVDTNFSRQIFDSEKSMGQLGHIFVGKMFKNGEFIYGTETKDVNIFSLSKKAITKTLTGHADTITGFVFLDDNTLISSSRDGSVRFWDLNNNREIVKIVESKDGSYVVADDSFRFDTNKLENNDAIAWIAKDDPLRPLPLELFMKNYYEPRLLMKRLTKADLSPLKSIADLNRAQPRVQILDITPDASGQTVTARVKVTGQERTLNRDGQPVTFASGASDLRLFRDGQLVAYAPDNARELVLDGATKEATFTFPNIKIPRDGQRELEFSAYAFNVDGVKSATDRKKFTIPNPQTVNGNAYLVSIGVNAYEDQKMDLQFAVNDAVAINAALRSRLTNKAGSFNEVVPVVLTSDFTNDGGGRTVTVNNATKATIKAVFSALAGKTPQREEAGLVKNLFNNLFAKGGDLASKGVPNLEKLRPANPEDFIFVSVASHGYVDEAGVYYIIPSDAGPKEAFDALLARSISSDELLAWLRDIDAKNIVLVIDACHSAAAVQGAEFKPGPMDSRGLGQLAYNKGMQVLTSTNADDVALEDASIRHGFLTYALVQDGLNEQRADVAPSDGRITMEKWLKYGAARVPSLYAELKSGALRTKNGARSQTRLVELKQRGFAVNGVGAERSQQPNFFNFAPKRNDLLLESFTPVAAAPAPRPTVVSAPAPMPTAALAPPVAAYSSSSSSSAGQEIEQTIRRYFSLIASKDVRGALALCSSARVAKVKLAKLEEIAQSTEYYTVESIAEKDSTSSARRMSVLVNHKLAKKPLERWALELVLVREDGQWKLDGFSGNKI